MATNTIKLIWPNALALANAAAHFIVTESNIAIAKKGNFTIALSGGSTPKLLLQLLAQSPYKNNINWKKVIIAFGDERFVPPNSADSNYKMANDVLLTQVPIPKKNILKINTVGISPQQSASKYQITLKQYIDKKNPFDLILLGIGEEGHTASVFPNSKLITDKKNWVQHIWVTEKNMERISFTIPFINQAKNIVFLVSGESKAAILKKFFTKSGASLPAAKVKGVKNTFWFVDEAANKLS
jgi:6-phosphogluconolactonase